jgi:hypothetical protein
MAEHQRDWKADVDAIRKILISEWDPVGCGVPEDEYDLYISGIYKLMQNHVSVEELARHLESVETIRMGLASDLERDRRCAKMLIGLMA